MTQLQIHKKIDDFIKTDTSTATIEVAKSFITHNEDSKRYFFSQADEKWLGWFFENNLFYELKNKSKDPNVSGYSLPELEYLTRMADKQSCLVKDIILSVPISEETFNPEVIDRFFWITSLLPPEEIKHILPKILKEEWLKLMSRFGKSGYEYQQMVEKLGEVKDYDSLLILSKIILTVREKKEFSNSDNFSISDKLFYLGDISATGIFENIVKKDNPQKEDFLGILCNKLTEIVNLGDKEEDTVFEKVEPFYLLDVNTFKLNLDTNKRSHHREDIQNLVATLKELIDLTVGSKCENQNKSKEIYQLYIEKLPDSLTCWRLKLYSITRCPQNFKKEIKEFLFRVFTVGERYFDLDTGAEYHEGLIAGFDSLGGELKRDYINKVIEYYGKTLEDDDREKWRKRDGLEIVFYLKKYLSTEELIKAEKVFGNISDDIKIKPHPSVGEITMGSVTHRSPFNPADKTIDELINHLKTDSTPESLDKKFKSDDFFNRRGVEGLGDAIKDDFKNRKKEYLSKIECFFDRDKIDANYLYSIFRQIEDMLRAKDKFSDAEYLMIINVFELIKKSGDVKEFEHNKEKTYLADWITVHRVMADITLEMLAAIKNTELFTNNRDKIFEIIKYLLSIKNSPSNEEDNETADSANVAINSVRGQAYRAFVQLTYNDGDKPLSKDIKDFYKEILSTESSSAVRFTIGQFVSSFYFRDIDFIRNLLPEIFPKDKIGSEKIFFSTWEGYLSSSLHKELFDDLGDYYEYAIKVSPDQYPEKKYRKGLDELLSVHIALAYAHFDFKIGDPLFDLFWNTRNETRHHEFTSFIGRSCISRDGAGDAWFAENNVDKNKLVEFWNWIISTDITVDSKAFSGFGFWINPGKEIIDDDIVIKNLVITLEKSNGDIDWDYGFTRRINIFSEIDPVNTLKIIREFLTHDDELNTNRKYPIFHIDTEIKEALKNIYRNEELKDDVVGLINFLIVKGSTPFWVLKEVIK